MAGWICLMIASGTPLVRETMAMRLKQLEDENSKLKRLVTDVMLDNVVLRDLPGKPCDTGKPAGCSAAGVAGSSDLAASGLCPGPLSHMRACAAGQWVSIRKRCGEIGRPIIRISARK